MLRRFKPLFAALEVSEEELRAKSTQENQARGDKTMNASVSSNQPRRRVAAYAGVSHFPSGTTGELPGPTRVFYKTHWLTAGLGVLRGFADKGLSITQTTNDTGSMCGCAAIVSKRASTAHSRRWYPRSIWRYGCNPWSCGCRRAVPATIRRAARKKKALTSLEAALHGEYTFFCRRNKKMYPRRLDGRQPDPSDVRAGQRGAPYVAF